jgi:hypothetical protein
VRNAWPAKLSGAWQCPGGRGPRIHIIRAHNPNSGGQTPVSALNVMTFTPRTSLNVYVATSLIVRDTLWSWIKATARPRDTDG